MYMLIFKVQTNSEPTQTRKPAYLNLDSPPYHRCVIVWSSLLFGIFPLSVSGSPNMKISRSVIPDSPQKSLHPSSDLSSIPSDVEADFDLIEKQKLVQPREGNLISKTEWTPIATTSNKGTKKKKRALPREIEPTRFPEWTPEISTYLSRKPKPPRRKKQVQPLSRIAFPLTSLTVVLIDRPILHSNYIETRDLTKLPYISLFPSFLPSSSLRWAPILEMAATSQLNNNNKTANEENNSRPTPEPELDLLDYSEEMTRDINSVPPLQNAFGNLGSSLPQINEDDMRPQAQGARPSESGISPALINSRATSLALETMSNRSTPVPRPVERQTFAVHTSTATNLTIQSPTPRQFNQNPIPTLSPSPAPTGQVDIIVDNQDLEVFINLFNDQWLMFIQARDNNNVPLMRAALTQAISSQEVIRDLAGGEEMLRISKNWIAREELADLERSQQANPTPPVQRLAITQRAHSHTISPSPAPQPLTRQASEITYLGSGQQQLQNQTTSQRPQTAHRQHQDTRTQSAQGNHLPPPPPPSTQPP
ncbi:hypothetical protein PGT21_009822 [Puccinia graminis f. sp. tritici]|uniref:Uncharacterized protein n=1 Tax=Puccinia graminis f. sp. tritici TaxID=56615 RepID=A0A5B0QHT9_PUCGR|nr:hypothetical protein PGT21_009822 [Puccinia graminis f. sp. tritici]